MWKPMSTRDEQVEAEIQEISELYEEADAFSREVSEFRDEAVIPAMNELRYAGHHFIHAIVSDDISVTLRELKSSRSHCERALYESSEAGMTAAGLEIIKVRDDYPSLNLEKLIPGYGGYVTEVRKAQQMVVKGRTNRESVQAHTREYMHQFRNLRDSAEAIFTSIDRLNAQVDEDKREDRKYLRRLGLQIVGSILAIVVANWILGLF